jgi:hypothetical protein
MTDARYVAPVSEEHQKDPAEAIYQSYQNAFMAYLRSDLNVHDVGEYLSSPPGLEKMGFDGWGWDGTGISPFANWPYSALLSPVFSANPKFQVLIVNGWQDTQTTVGAAVLLAEQSGWPRDRVKLGFYQGGHMTYSVEASLKEFANDLRHFITTAH